MWRQLKSGFKSMISDIDGDISSKRIITLIFVFAVLITWYANLFFKLEIQQFIFEGLLYIIGVGLGVITAEKFSSRGTTSQ